MALRRVRNASPVAMAFLVGANLVPLVGVLFLGWSLTTLVALYWLENGVVGVFAVGRILTVGGVPPASPPGRGSSVRPNPMAAAGLGWLPRLVVVPFFVVHYGMFWVVHGVFVWVALPSLFEASGTPVGPPEPSVVLLGGAALVLSHGASFVLNWLAGGEYRTSTPAAEMGAPYARVAVLHLTILFGAFAVAILGAPIWALVVMVAVKTAADLSAHVRERERAAGRAQSLAAVGAGG